MQEYLLENGSSVIFFLTIKYKVLLNRNSIAILYPTSICPQVGVYPIFDVYYQILITVTYKTQHTPYEKS